MLLTLYMFGVSWRCLSNGVPTTTKQWRYGMMKFSFAVAAAAAVFTLGQTAFATNFTVKNNCSGSITVYVGGSAYTTLGSGASTGLSEGTWNGRIQDNLTPGASLSEWNLTPAEPTGTM
jgi:hypothetical protein